VPSYVGPRSVPGGCICGLPANALQARIFDRVRTGDVVDTLTARDDGTARRPVREQFATATVRETTHGTARSFATP
jgi:hypothetical protein